MGSGSSRPRNDDNQPQSHPSPVILGPFLLRRSNQHQRPGPYNPTFFPTHPNPANNGQYHGVFQQNRLPPQGPQQQPYPGAVTTDKSLLKTETIRNAVNVKKDRIRITPLPGDPTKLAVSFEFDASSPCVVSVFICGKEHVGVEDACRIVPAKQPAVTGGHYEKGIGLSFPRVDAQPSSQAIIDLSLYSEQEVREVQEATQWPLVIRLECVTEAGLEQGHSLSELTPGGPQKVWVQSQTTFATLHKNEDGEWETNQMKQKIMVNGVSYELQSIFGMDQNDKKNREGGRQAQGLTAEQDEERLCVICLVNERDTTVLPCRHMCMCHECAQELRKQTSKCPICREHVESLLYIRMKQAPNSTAAVPIDQGTVAAALEKLRIVDVKSEKSRGSIEV